jgi:hypothetical protein
VTPCTWSCPNTPKRASTRPKRYVAEGEWSGRANLIVEQLTQRFGVLTYAAKEQIAGASVEELNAIGKRLLTAATLQEAIDAS